MLAGDVVELSADGSPRRHHVGTVAATIRLRISGGYVMALERGFAFVDDSFQSVTALPEVFSDPEIRMNDGGCDPQGRFYCGTMAYHAREGAGTLYRLDADGRVTPVLPGVTISNGIQWSADGTTVYYSDTGTGRVDAFDFDADDGTLSNRRPFATVDPSEGAPDGVAIDTEGGIWVALWQGSRVHRYDQTGTLSDVLELPVSNVTACTFGGDDLSSLYITTSRLDIDAQEQPQAGAVFMTKPGVTGAAPHAFAG
jgi:sugar lactone lactonase YvrE